MSWRIARRVSADADVAVEASGERSRALSRGSMCVAQQAPAGGVGAQGQHLSDGGRHDSNVQT